MRNPSYSTVFPVSCPIINKKGFVACVLHAVQCFLLSLSLELSLLSLLCQTDPMKVKIHAKEVRMMEMLGISLQLVAKLISLHSNKRQEEHLNGFHLYLRYIWYTVGNTAAKEAA